MVLSVQGRNAHSAGRGRQELHRVPDRGRLDVLTARCAFHQFPTNHTNRTHPSAWFIAAGTPHCPVRYADTVGIVIERVRPEKSIDRLRWYCRSGKHEKPSVIREVNFHCTDLGKQLKNPIRVSCGCSFISCSRSRADHVSCLSCFKEWQSDPSLRTCPECGEVAPPQ